MQKNSAISKDVHTGENVYIGDYCILGHPTKKSTIGKDVTLDSLRTKGFIVGAGTRIGNNSVIRSHSVIYNHVVTGNNFRTGHGVLIREHTSIGDNVVIGSGAILDGYISIGDGSQIQSNCYVSQSVIIGKNVFIAPGTNFYDNKKIILDVGQDLAGAVVEDYARIGGSCVILPSVKIGKYAFVGAGSVVTRDVPDKSVAYGNPAIVKRKLTEKEIKEYIDSLKK